MTLCHTTCMLGFSPLPQHLSNSSRAARFTWPFFFQDQNIDSSHQGVFAATKAPFILFILWHFCIVEMLFLFYTDGVIKLI